MPNTNQLNTAEKSSPQKNVKSRIQQKEETRARILQCALDVFAERGFAGAGVRDIASAAGVNHGLILYHFKDKDGLWRAAVDFLFERLHDEMKEPEEVSTLSTRNELGIAFIGTCITAQNTQNTQG